MRKGRIYGRSRFIEQLPGPSPRQRFQRRAVTLHIQSGGSRSRVLWCSRQSRGELTLNDRVATKPRFQAVGTRRLRTYVNTFRFLR